MNNLLFMYKIIKLNKNKLIYVYVNLLLIFIFSFIYWYYGTPDNLTFNTQFADTDNNIAYLSALYFACTTHSTVGFGDITPKSRFMQMLVIIQLIILILNLSILIL
jgi:hypothetical protein